MSAYLKFFELEQSPFEGKAQSKVVLGTRALRDAFAAIRDGLSEGSARICVNGGPGFGKTSLARSLPKLLGDSARVAVVLDPSVPWESLRNAIAKQWRLEAEGLARSALLEAARETRLVLVVDRAEQATEDFLDHLDIMLSVRSEVDEPAVQSVLLACLSTSDGRQPPPLIWWLDRIQTLQLEFAPIPREGVESYIHKHLKRAGWRGEHLFKTEAALAIHGVTGGIPGEISSLCERLLAQAALAGHHEIDADFVHSALDETGDEQGQDDTESTIEDEFEELVHEEEFEGASPQSEPDSFEDTNEDALSTEEDHTEAVTHGVETAPAAPSLAQTLEHFEQAREEEGAADTRRASDEIDEREGARLAEADDEGTIELSVEVAESTEDAPPTQESEGEIDGEDLDSLILLEEYLGAPASPEELLAIRRGAWTRHLRVAAAAAAAILIGASALSWLGGDDDDSSPQSARFHPTSGSQMGADGKVLVRLRGPVTEIGASPELAATLSSAESAAPVDPTESRLAQVVSTASGDMNSAENDTQGDTDPDDLEEIFEPDDFVDMRPASMRPDALAGSDADERFW